MDNLKPCPFCGGEAKTVVEYNKCGGDELIMSAYVQCSVCGTYKRKQFDAMHKPFSYFENVFAEAISLWNQRV